MTEIKSNTDRNKLLRRKKNLGDYQKNYLKNTGNNTCVNRQLKGRDIYIYIYRHNKITSLSTYHLRI